MSEAERNEIKVGDKIVYYGQGLVFGVFEAVALVESEFKGWQKPYPFQVKLKLIALAEKGLLARPLESKILMQKSADCSANLAELGEKALIDHETGTWVVYVFWNNCKCGWIKKYEKYRQENKYPKTGGRLEINPKTERK